MHVRHLVAPADTLFHDGTTQGHRRTFIHLHQLPVISYLHWLLLVLTPIGQRCEHPAELVPYRPVRFHHLPQIFIKIDERIGPRRYPGVFLPPAPVIGLDSFL